MASLTDLAIVIAEDIDGIDQRLTTVETTVARIQRANTSTESLGGAAPSGTAPPGWVVRDLDTGNEWRWE